MTAEQNFPTDETTLTMLIAACQMNPDTGQTHLHDFLDMGTRVKSLEDITHEIGDGEGAPVYFVEYEDGYAPYSEHDVIETLAEEVLRLRAELNSSPRSEELS